MVRNLLVYSFLLAALFGCQKDNTKSQDDQILDVISSQEFRDLVDARTVPFEHLKEQADAEHQAFLAEIEGLSLEEMKERREAWRQARKDQQNARLEMLQKVQSRNNEWFDLRRTHPEWSEDELEEAMKKVDERLGVRPEMLATLNSFKMNKALSNLIVKFPFIKEEGYQASFITKCFDRYSLEQSKSISSVN